MGKRMPKRLDDDDYDDNFDEPNYDNLSDEELDELYYFGEIRSARKPKKLVRKKPDASKVVQKLFPDVDDDDWRDDDGEDLYEED